MKKRIVSLVLVVGLAGTLAGCSSSNQPASATAAKTASAEPLKMGRVDYAAHGENAVVLGAVAAVQGDKIVGASIDDYQFIADGKGVPNSDKGLAKGYADPKNH